MQLNIFILFIIIFVIHIFVFGLDARMFKIRLISRTMPSIHNVKTFFAKNTDTFTLNLILGNKQAILKIELGSAAR